MIDGGPPPDGGYTTPDKYTPDDLGTKKVWESQGRLHLTLPTSALRFLDLDEGDCVTFYEGGIEEKMVAVKNATND